ncbi:hypothetical protein [Mesorhizobium sp. M1406]|uniref:hypothetical protein n=1 Tax=Mesorhizobium sp. M1406 TaxID=2957099 RepID=UPI00333AB553
MAAKVWLSVGSNHSALATPAFRLSQILSYPAEEGECPALALDPVRQFLAEAGMGEGEGRGAQHCNEDLSLVDVEVCT